MISYDELLELLLPDEIEKYVSSEQVKFYKNLYYIEDRKLLVDLTSKYVFFNIDVARKLFIHIRNEQDLLYIKFLINLVSNDAYHINYDVMNLDDNYNFVIDFYKNRIISKNKEMRDIVFNKSSKEINLFKYFCERENYLMASEVAARLYDMTFDIKYLALQYICEKQRDFLFYINQNSNDGERRYERKLCVSFLLDPMSDDTFEHFNRLEFLYKDKDYSFFENIKMMYGKYRKMLIDHHYVSNHGEYNELGERDETIKSLLLQNDLFRLSDVINASDNTIFSIKNQIYKVLCDLLLKYNKINTGYIKKSLDLYSSLDDTDLAKYHISSISGDIIRKKYRTKEELHDVHNYYSDYKDYLEHGEYKEALDAIVLFIESLRKSGLTVDLSYLVSELTIYIYNSEGNDYINNSHMKEYIMSGISKYEENKYEEAIECFETSLSFMKIKNPTIIAYIAKCYYYLGNYDMAIENFEIAEYDYLYPDDYLLFIDALYRTNNYISIPLLIKKYKSISKEDNIWIHYLLSIIYIKVGKYNDALIEIYNCEEIAKEILNIDIRYINERKIIQKLINGEDTVMYTLDNYIDFSLNQSELELLDNIMHSNYTNEELYDNFIKEGIASLFSICKILYILGYNDRINDLVELFYGSKDNEFTLKLKNYRFL